MARIMNHITLTIRFFCAKLLLFYFSGQLCLCFCVYLFLLFVPVEFACGGTSQPHCLNFSGYQNKINNPLRDTVIERTKTQRIRPIRELIL